MCRKFSLFILLSLYFKEITQFLFTDKLQMQDVAGQEKSAGRSNIRRFDSSNNMEFDNNGNSRYKVRNNKEIISPLDEIGKVNELMIQNEVSLIEKINNSLGCPIN